MSSDRRLIEDYIPIEAISIAGAREKSARQGHISTLHLWWARRPLSAARAAVYATMMPAPTSETERKERAEFMARLCRWDAAPTTIREAREQVLAAHKARAGSDEPPRILDMFAGGGAIPLEAQRLGAQAYAVDLNPVAYIIELCTLVYPQKYGIELATLVRKWGNWVIEKVHGEIGDLYPAVANPNYLNPASSQGISAIAADQPTAPFPPSQQVAMPLADQPITNSKLKTQNSKLTPVAYLWTRTVPCKNPTCGGVVPLARQYWLAKKEGRFVALKPEPDKQAKWIHYRVVKATTEVGLGFNPAAGSERGNVTCPFCGNGTDLEYVKQQGCGGRMSEQLIAVICAAGGRGEGKVYLSPDEAPNNIPDNAYILQRIAKLIAETGISMPDQPVESRNKLNIQVPLYGFDTFASLFTARQMLSMLTFVKYARRAYDAMLAEEMDAAQAKAITTYLGVLIDRLADRNSTLTHWDNSRETTANTFTRQALPMVWDFIEIEPTGGGSGGAVGAINWIAQVIERNVGVGLPTEVQQDTASRLSFQSDSMDAIVTDPPYYDNVAYADLSDYFYVWLRLSIRSLYPEIFKQSLILRDEEAVSSPGRHGGDKKTAEKDYEAKMAQAFAEAHRVLKPNAPFIVVYAHRTTSGWTTLIDALRKADFVITEAWPLDTEMSSRLIAQDSAAFASSIFIVARRREGNLVGDSDEVRPELQRIIRERVETLMNENVAGSDLFIASVGAGLKAYTKYARIEQPNGDEFPTSQYLELVQREVLRVVLDKVFSDVEGATADTIQQIDQPTRFYVLARYQYGVAAMPFDEINTLLRAISSKLEAAQLATGRHPLLKSGKTVRVLDYRDRGRDPDLGSPDTHPKVIDLLHRLMWLNENEPGEVRDFVRTLPTERLASIKLVAEALQGKTLDKTNRTPEQSAATKLLQGWKGMAGGISGFGPLFDRSDDQFPN